MNSPIPNLDTALLADAILPVQESYSFMPIETKDVAQIHRLKRTQSFALVELNVKIFSQNNVHLVH